MRICSHLSISLAPTPPPPLDSSSHSMCLSSLVLTDCNSLFNANHVPDFILLMLSCLPPPVRRLRELNEGGLCLHYRSNSDNESFPGF